MRRMRGLGVALLALGLLATLGAVAPATARRRSHHAAGRHRCAAHSATHHHRTHARRETRCRPSRRPETHHRRASSPGSRAPGVAGAPSTGGPAPPPATSPPAPSSPGAPLEPPEIAPPSVPHVQVTAVEYHFTLSRATVPAGEVVFQFVNHGQDEHNLNLLSPQEDNDRLFNNTVSNGVGSMQVNLRPGAYTLFCSLPEHEQKGMKATLVVE
jgi:plastocyanin